MKRFLAIAAAVVAFATPVMAAESFPPQPQPAYCEMYPCGQPSPGTSVRGLAPGAKLVQTKPFPMGTVLEPKMGKWGVVAFACTDLDSTVQGFVVAQTYGSGALNTYVAMTPSCGFLYRGTELIFWDAKKFENEASPLFLFVKQKETGKFLWVLDR